MDEVSTPCLGKKDLPNCNKPDRICEVYLAQVSEIVTLAAAALCHDDLDLRQWFDQNVLLDKAGHPIFEPSAKCFGNLDDNGLMRCLNHCYAVLSAHLTTSQQNLYHTLQPIAWFMIVPHTWQGARLAERSSLSDPVINTVWQGTKQLIQIYKNLVDSDLGIVYTNAKQIEQRVIASCSQQDTYKTFVYCVVDRATGAISRLMSRPCNKQHTYRKLDVVKYQGHLLEPLWREVVPLNRQLSKTAQITLKLTTFYLALQWDRDWLLGSTGPPKNPYSSHLYNDTELVELRAQSTLQRQGCIITESISNDSLKEVTKLLTRLKSLEILELEETRKKMGRAESQDNGSMLGTVG